jgi:cytochrome P450
MVRVAIIYTVKANCNNQKLLGTIVRINPREIHIKDPAFYDEIYTSRKRVRHKDPAFTVALLTPGAMASTNDHEQHRLRRALLNNFFSKRSVMVLEETIREKVNMLRKRFVGACQEKVVLNIPSVFAALTADVITHYSHGKSLGYLDVPDFKNDMMEALDSLFRIFHINRFLPKLAVMLSRPPFWIIEVLGLPEGLFGEMIDARLRTRKRAADALNKKAKTTGRPETIFDALTAESVPKKERTLSRLVDEASVIFGAGTETTARALSVAAFYLARDKDLRQKLFDELTQVMPSPASQPKWAELERLPFLVSLTSCAIMERVSSVPDRGYSRSTSVVVWTQQSIGSHRPD